MQAGSYRTFLERVMAMTPSRVALRHVIWMSTFSTDGSGPLFFGRRKAAFRFSWGRDSADVMRGEVHREEQEERDRESRAAD
jgi:hypothetical protein